MGRAMLHLLRKIDQFGTSILQNITSGHGTFITDARCPSKIYSSRLHLKDQQHLNKLRYT